MNEEFVVILGSGISINDLTDEERLFLNKCSVKIGINKYAAFYEKAGIVPTHIYYTDDYYPASICFYNYLIKKIKRNIFSEIVLITSNNFRKYTLVSRGVLLNLIPFITNYNLIRLYLIKLFHRLKLRNFINKLIAYEEKEVMFKLAFIPKGSKIESVRIISHLNEFAPWATSLSEPLYHFKGSLSTVFNYISIFFPGKKILLVGVDFNSPDYFFEKDLDALNIDTRDWTYELRIKEKKHYSIIVTDGKIFDDGLPYMLDNLYKNGISVYSLNEKSYLVQKGYISPISFKELNQNTNESH